MDHYHTWFDLKQGTKDTAFARAMTRYMNHLKDNGLIEGWRLSPIAAAAAVSVLPACALLSAPLARRVPAVAARAAAGARRFS